MKEQILKLRSEGKTYKQICEILGCSKNLPYYYCGKNQKEKYKIRTRKYRAKQHPFKRKLDFFCRTWKSGRKYTFDKYNNINSLQKKVINFSRNNNQKYGVKNNMKFTLEDVINKFGENPKCYLTGDEINIYQLRTYHFDHIIPLSRGGTNDLDNLGICTKEANRAKRNMTPERIYQSLQKSS